jgi:hypothetical protein
MSRGMLLGIRERAQRLAETGSLPPVPAVTPTPEVFIPLEEAIPEEEIVLEGVHLDIVNVSLSKSFPADCRGEAPACTRARTGSNILAVTFQPRDLPEGQMLAYKNLPAVEVALESNPAAPSSLYKYDNNAQTLTLGFEVPESAAVFGLQWAGLREIPLEITPATLDSQIVGLSEFGQTISLAYDASLASQVETRTAPAVPLSDQILFAEAHPASAQIRFLDFGNGRPYDLPLLPLENRVAQVMVFRTADFPGYGDDNPFGFAGQQQALAELLETGVDPSRCTQPLAGYDSALPFLPWINMRQSFCAQPQILEFSGGRGIRYLTYYAQAPGPALDQQIFYTFQGLTEDGQFYVSALFPVQTGIFPTEAPACPRCGEPDYDPIPEWTAALTEQLTQLNAKSEDSFAPALGALDELIESIRMERQ